MDTIDYIFLGYYVFIVLVIVFLLTAGNINFYDLIREMGVTPKDDKGMDVIINGDKTRIPPDVTKDPEMPNMAGKDPATLGTEEVYGFQGNKGKYQFGIDFKKPRNVYVDEQNAFLSMNLQPTDMVGGEHGLPIEGMRSGGYIPLPYSEILGIDTNESSTMNL